MLWCVCGGEKKHISWQKVAVFPALSPCHPPIEETRRIVVRDVRTEGSRHGEMLEPQ